MTENEAPLTVTVRAFASLAELMGREATLELAGSATVGSLRTSVRNAFPTVTVPFMVAVNERYASDNDSVGAADTIALIPPVAGG